MTARQTIPKAFVLAAGKGTRLRPITNKLPKPLVPIFGHPLLDYQFNFLKTANVQNIAINSCYLSEEISKYIEANPFFTNVFHSIEPGNEPLGTGGAYLPLMDWIGDDPLLVVNGDILANFDFKALYEQHIRSGVLITMVLLPKPVENETKIYKKDDTILSFGEPRSHNDKMTSHCWACCMVFSPKFKPFLTANNSPFGLIPCILSAMEAGHKIGAFIHEGYWFDLGTPEKYLYAHQYFLNLGEKDLVYKALNYDRLLQSTGANDRFVSDNDCIVDYASLMYKHDQADIDLIEEVTLKHGILIKGGDRRLYKESINCIVGPDYTLTGLTA